ncbi:hypothetical protein B4U79_17311 [Dinothrombium tinctorium]|uniref:Peptidase A2 domain-containing protein n=1 Tax=Dinothrombium tinctorium TaxID=1965070 RepID=A0A443RG27_9ACAR|nr:hypothetical protein B4U79_17311 [Dinothrombium tinctorium]
MGNQCSQLTHLPEVKRLMKINPPLHEFIEEECPLVNRAIGSCDARIKSAVLNEFNRILPKRHFESINELLLYIEQKRIQRIDFLASVSAPRFERLPEIKFPCVPIKIGDKILMTFLDSGCGMSSMTRIAAYKLGFSSHINPAVKGLATGFGNNVNIVGVLPNVNVQFGDIVFLATFVVIDKAVADFIIIGADFMMKHRIKLDFKTAEVVFPRKVIEEKAFKFMPPLKNAAVAAEFIVSMLENVNVPRTLGFLPDIVNQRNVFVDAKINEIQVQVMIDSGAESSMMSRKAASHLRLFKYTDLRKSRISSGLGPVVVIGKIPPVPIEFDSHTILFMPFDVLYGVEFELIILGSDFLTWYGCQIDFDSKRLNIRLDSLKSYAMHQCKCEKQEWLRSTGLGSLFGAETGETDANETSEIRLDSLNAVTISL